MPLPQAETAMWKGDTKALLKVQKIHKDLVNFDELSIKEKTKDIIGVMGAWEFFKNN